MLFNAKSETRETRDIDATTAMIWALRRFFAGHRVAILEVHGRAWSSITFDGMHHKFTLRVKGSDELPSELELRDHVLCDISGVRRGELVYIEALTVRQA